MLSSGDQKDIVVGGNGKDVLRGGGSRDLIDGGKGRDRFIGGGGDDTIQARDGLKERIKCGPGYDFVKGDREDTLIGCEHWLVK